MDLQRCPAHDILLPRHAQAVDGGGCLQVWENSCEYAEQGVKDRRQVVVLAI
jgi:hypothetical protein